MDPMAALPSTRRFIYLIVDGGDDTHTLHRIDTDPLFAGGRRRRAKHGPRPEATATQLAAAGATQPLPLPPPLARFDCASGRQFFPLGSGVERIVGVDRHRHTVIFDTRTDAVRAGPDARHVKWNSHGSTWAEAGGRLYHLGRGPGYEEQEWLDFEALTYDDRRDDWSWSLLPSPPFERFADVPVLAFADAGAAGSAIRISTMGGGTYEFDAARASWRKQGDWELPFCGRAQYVADYGLWFGFADREASGLCAVDLNVAGRPKWRHFWANVDGGCASQAGLWLERSYLSYLGSGKFCVTRFFDETDKEGRSIVTAVVTAVEATRAAASGNRDRDRDRDRDSRLQMVTRGSVRYHSLGSRWPACWAY